MISTTLVNRTIVLTGAAGGIGAACAHAFSELGAGITLLDSSADGLARLSAELSRPPASAAVCDLTDPRAVANAFDEVGARFGRIDALVNLVGVSGRGRIEDVSDDTWNQVISVNLTSVFYTCRAALPWIRAAGGGTVVNVASCAGLREQPGSLAYSASKGGVVMLSRTLAADLGKEGIRVHAVCPTAVDTDMIIGYFDAFEDPVQARVTYEANQPMGRLITVGEIADEIVALCLRQRPYTPEPLVV